MALACSIADSDMSTSKEEGLSAPQECRIRVGSVDVRYLVAGAGSPVLLVHGLGNSAAAWRSNIGPLSEGFHVYAVDLPGHGLSAPYNGKYSLSYGAHFIGGFLDALNLKSVGIIGSSLGGMLALKTALDLPEKVKRLVLVGSAGLGREMAPFLRWLTIPILGQLMARPSRRTTRLSLEKAVFDPSFITDDLVEEAYRYRAIPGATSTMLKILRTGTNIRGQKAGFVLLDQLDSLGTPTLILWGAQDSIFPVAHARRAHGRIPGSKLHIFQDCGHWPQMEKSEEFNALVTQFLL
ncbi:MAG: alpha/beta fold hydrolase [Chloroflexi bacterium]|nr:alpha/beta fold hydrolase [Chloroflexota bacterium]